MRAQVNIVPASPAPLAPRVFVPPIPTKLALPSFEGLSLELQEATIIEDILYVLMVSTSSRIILTSRALKVNTSAITTHTTIPTKLTVSPEQNSKSPRDLILVFET
jgi:hypothetical protein